MDRRDALKLTGMALIGAAGIRPFAAAAHQKDHAMSFDRKAIESLAAAYTAAWNSGSPQRVAGHFAENGEIVINRGTPWRGRPGVAEMAAGFFADVPDMKLTCDIVRCAGSHVAYVWCSCRRRGPRFPKPCADEVSGSAARAAAMTRSRARTRDTPARPGCFSRR